jgi:hypothetical protein
MTGLQRKGHSGYCTFRYLGNRHIFTVGPVPEDIAEATGRKVDLVSRNRDRGSNLSLRFEQGWQVALRDNLRALSFPHVTVLAGICKFLRQFVARRMPHHLP